MAPPRKYPDELRARAVRLYRESEPKPVIRRLAEQLGVHHEALRNWIRQAEADAGGLEQSRRVATFRAARCTALPMSGCQSAVVWPCRRRTS